MSQDMVTTVPTFVGGACVAASGFVPASILEKGPESPYVLCGFGLLLMAAGWRGAFGLRKTTCVQLQTCTGIAVVATIISAIRLGTGPCWPAPLTLAGLSAIATIATVTVSRGYRHP